MNTITNQKMAEKIKAHCGHFYDPAYVGAVRKGRRKSPELLALIQRFEAENTPKQTGAPDVQKP